MSTTLTLKIPDQIYRPLQKKADKCRKNLDQVLIEWLGDVVKDELDDPLLNLAGAFSSDIKDISSNHDFYIRQELRTAHE